jgi:putative membrane protein
MSTLLHDALLLYGHLFCIITLAALLAGELIVFRKSLPADLLRRLQLIDRWYGIFAGLVILSGLSLLFSGPQGSQFFTQNPVFWTKMALFFVIALLSILPTIRYLQWNGRKESDGSIRLGDAEYRQIRMLLVAQVCLFVFIPLCATLMTAGI